MTDEARKHLSAARIGMEFSDEHKANISKSKSGKNHPMWNKHHSEKTKNKIKSSNITNRDRTSKQMLDRWQDPQFRERMLLILNSPENLDRLRENVMKQSESEEYRKTISKRMIELWKDPQFRDSLSGENANAWRGGKVSIVCKTCGKPFDVAQSNATFARFCSQECCHVAWVGENNPNWAGGTTSERTLFMGTKEYKNWRSFVFERDKYTCRECGRTNTYLNAHHILKYVDYPMHILNPNNGITLCIDCHNNIHGREENYVEHYFEIIYIHEVTSDSAGTLTKDEYTSGA